MIQEGDQHEDEDASDFVCIECGEDLGEDETCENEECPLFGTEDVSPEGWEP